MDPVDDIETPQVAESDGHEADATAAEIDLDAIERDLADVEIALSRLDAGTYWTCEETGRTLSDELMESNPTARRAPTG